MKQATVATAVYLIIPCKGSKIASVSRAQKDLKADRWDTNVDSCISLKLVGLAKGRLKGFSPRRSRDRGSSDQGQRTSFPCLCREARSITILEGASSPERIR